MICSSDASCSRFNHRSQAFDRTVRNFDDANAGKSSEENKASNLRDRLNIWFYRCGVLRDKALLFLADLSRRDFQAMGRLSSCKDYHKGWVWPDYPLFSFQLCLSDFKTIVWPSRHNDPSWNGHIWHSSSFQFNLFFGFRPRNQRIGHLREHNPFCSLWGFDIVYLWFLGTVWFFKRSEFNMVAWRPYININLLIWSQDHDWVWWGWEQLKCQGLWLWKWLRLVCFGDRKSVV